MRQHLRAVENEQIEKPGEHRKPSSRQVSTSQAMWTADEQRRDVDWIAADPGHRLVVIGGRDPKHPSN